MSFLPASVIKAKRDGKSLSQEEIQQFITGYHKDEIPDYQMAALLMAIVLKGMSKQETADLTHAMLHSGKTLSFKNSTFLPVDKHSTGGIGDKTSLLLAPIVASCDVPVPMIAGRGLGHTGGTLDKLESIPGFNVNLSLEQFQAQVESMGCAIIGQTKDICPADKKMYALRDVTATVESLPLICGSILSKKIAEGIKGLVLDVKCGSGAFMKTPEQATELAQWLVETAEKNGVSTTALITNMEEPLGHFIGNALEVWECLSIFKNEEILGWKPESFADCRQLTLELCAEMLVRSGKADSADVGFKLAEDALNSGRAFEKFEEMVKAQGGNLDLLPLPEDQYWHHITASQNGFLENYNTEAIGIAGICLGAGRKITTDVIDPTASIICYKKIGDEIKKDDTLFSIYTNKKYLAEEAQAHLNACYKISLQKPQRPSLILKRIYGRY